MLKTFDLNLVIQGSGMDALPEFLQSYENTLNSFLIQLKELISTKRNSDIIECVNKIIIHAKLINAERLQKVSENLIEKKEFIGSEKITAFNVEVVRLKGEIAYRKYFLSEIPEIKSEHSRMLKHSMVLPSPLKIDDSDYPKEIKIPCHKFNEDFTSLFQSMQFKRTPTKNDIIVKKSNACCRCIIF